VKPSFRAEIDALDATYAAALEASADGLRAAVHALGSGPALFVGSGGSMALADLAARLHERVCRQPGQACTSLEALDAPQLARRGALLFSSSAKHPDAQRVLAHFSRRRFAPAVLVTHRDEDDVREFVGCDTRVVTLPRLVRPDGFLATGSIIQTATLLARAYLPQAELPPELPPAAGDAALREEVLVLSPPSLACVATDLEVRLVESGLATVQVSDYRNFAHGRHTGFARRAGGVTTPCDVRRWHGDGPWEETVIGLLHRSIRLAGASGDRVGLDIARPDVPAFGRRLYRLPLRRRLPDRPAAGVERKLLAAGCGEDRELRRDYVAAAAAWREKLSERRFGGLVLDYDGTVCWTQRRFELPDVGVREGLVAVLEAGAILGFASGRGRSLHADLRRWIAREHWERVVLGLYNGGVVLRLDGELPELREPTEWSGRVVAALAGAPYAHALEVEERGAQVSVTAGAVAHDGQLAVLLADRLAGAGVEASIAASGHAVDIVPPTSTKVAVLHAVEERADASALAIGDQGQLGGNDHALLARGPATLSVDRCSPDPNSCWFAGTGEHVGPALLERHLSALRQRAAGLALTRVEVT
jgi:hypothetical protein